MCNNVAEFGPPVLTDNGTLFKSMDIAKILRDWGIDQEFSGVYRPQGTELLSACTELLRKSLEDVANPLRKQRFGITASQEKVVLAHIKMFFFFFQI